MMGKRQEYLYLVVLLISLAIIPHWLGAYWLQMSIYLFWIIYLGSVWHLVLYGGLFSLGHGLFVGAGAYTSTLLWQEYGISPWVGMLAGMAVAGLLAISLGWLMFRAELPLLTFAAMSLAMSLIGMYAVESVTFLGATTGLTNFFFADNPWNYQWVGNVPYYYIIFIMAIGAVALCQFIFKSKMGLYLRASCENPRAAAAAGMNIFRTRLAILTISAVLTSMAGTFWAQYTNFITPNLLGPTTIINLALLVMIGGMRTVWGPVLGPAILVPFVWLLQAELGGRFVGIDTLVYGAVVLVLFLALRTGILPWWRQRRLGVRAPPSH